MTHGPDGKPTTDSPDHEPELLGIGVTPDAEATAGPWKALSDWLLVAGNDVLAEFTGPSHAADVALAARAPDLRASLAAAERERDACRASIAELLPLVAIKEDGPLVAIFDRARAALAKTGEPQ